MPLRRSCDELSLAPAWRAKSFATRSATVSSTSRYATSCCSWGCVSLSSPTRSESPVLLWSSSSHVMVWCRPLKHTVACPIQIGPPGSRGLLRAQRAPAPPVPFRRWLQPSSFVFWLLCDRPPADPLDDVSSSMGLSLVVLPRVAFSLFSFSAFTSSSAFFCAATSICFAIQVDSQQPVQHVAVQVPALPTICPT